MCAILEVIVSPFSNFFKFFHRRSLREGLGEIGCDGGLFGNDERFRHVSVGFDLEAKSGIGKPKFRQGLVIRSIKILAMRGICLKKSKNRFSKTS